MKSINPPNVGVIVKVAMEKQVADLMSKKVISRRQAASALIGQRESWYCQTQEGEYLTWVANGGEAECEK